MIVELTASEVLVCLNLSAGHQHSWPAPWLGDYTNILPSGQQAPALGHVRRLKLMEAHMALKGQPNTKTVNVEFTPSELWLMDETLFQVNYGGAHLTLSEKFFSALLTVHPELVATVDRDVVSDEEAERRRLFLADLDRTIND